MNHGDKHIFIWKELGGSNLNFYAGGKMHPVLFFKKLDRLLREASVPVEHKVRFAITCLRGPPLEWAESKKNL